VFIADFVKEVGKALGEVPADYLIEDVAKLDLAALDENLQRELFHHASRMKNLGS
jgi:hypothetical protein